MLTDILLFFCLASALQNFVFCDHTVFLNVHQPMEESEELVRQERANADSLHPYMREVYEKITRQLSSFTGCRDKVSLVKGVRPIKTRDSAGSNEVLLQFEIRWPSDMGPEQLNDAQLALAMADSPELGATVTVRLLKNPNRFGGNFKAIIATHTVNSKCPPNKNCPEYFTLNLTDAVKREKNMLYLVLSTESPSGPIPVKNVINYKNSSFKPLLVLFFGISNNGILPPSESKSKITKRSIHYRKRDFRSEREKEKADDEVNCHLHSWQVEINDLGLQHRVIAPTTYTVNYCIGSCPSPLLSSRYNVTNHTLLKDIYRLIHRQEDVSKLLNSHCVPVQYEPMSLLVMDKEDNLRVQVMEQMVATSCGCR